MIFLLDHGCTLKTGNNDSSQLLNLFQTQLPSQTLTAKV